MLHRISAWDWATSCEQALCKDKRNETPKPLRMPRFFRCREVSGHCTQIDAGGCLVGALDPVTSGEAMSYVFTVVDKLEDNMPIVLGFCSSPDITEAAQAKVAKGKKGASEAKEVCRPLLFRKCRCRARRANQQQMAAVPSDWTAAARWQYM